MIIDFSFFNQYMIIDSSFLLSVHDNIDIVGKILTVTHATIHNLHISNNQLIFLFFLINNQYMFKIKA